MSDALENPKRRERHCGRRFSYAAVRGPVGAIRACAGQMQAPDQRGLDDQMICVRS